MMEPGAFNDPEILERLSALPEDRILDYFWLMHRRRTDAMWLLKQMGCVSIDRPLDWDRAVIRRQHVESVRAGGIRLNRDRCFGCSRGDGSLYHHHIIEIQNGGSNQPRNQVPLCFACHKVLHPWLEHATQLIGFTHVCEFMSPAFEKIIETTEQKRA